MCILVQIHVCMCEFAILNHGPGFREQIHFLHQFHVHYAIQYDYTIPYVRALNWSINNVPKISYITDSQSFIKTSQAL